MQKTTNNHIPMNKEDAYDWAFDDVMSITTEHTDEQLNALALAIEKTANHYGNTCHAEILLILYEQREKLLAEEYDELEREYRNENRN